MQGILPISWADGLKALSFANLSATNVTGKAQSRRHMQVRPALHRCSCSDGVTTGRIPPEYFGQTGLQALTELWLSDNFLAGSIPRQAMPSSLEPLSCPQRAPPLALLTMTLPCHPCVLTCMTRTARCRWAPCNTVVACSTLPPKLKLVLGPGNDQICGSAPPPQVLSANGTAFTPKLQTCTWLDAMHAMCDLHQHMLCRADFVL